MSRKSFADLPDTIFCNILEYLDWRDLGSFDNVFLNRKARNSCLDALQTRQVLQKVEQNLFWNKALDNGILNWLISRNIWVISWKNYSVDDERLIAVVNGLPQLLT